MELYDVVVKFNPHVNDREEFGAMLTYLQTTFPRQCQVYGNFQGAFFEVWGRPAVESFCQKFQGHYSIDSISVKESAYKGLRTPPLVDTSHP